jgi:lectin-like protein
MKLTPWLAAEQDCEADAPDAHLVVINDVNEHFAIHGFSAGTNDVWIGYTDRVTDGMMRWVTPGTKDHLDPRPDPCFFGSAANPAGASCVTQMTQNACDTGPPPVGDWFYRDCKELHAYICERDGSPADPTLY